MTMLVLTHPQTPPHPPKYPPTHPHSPHSTIHPLPHPQPAPILNTAFFEFFEFISTHDFWRSPTLSLPWLAGGPTRGANNEQRCQRPTTSVWPSCSLSNFPSVRNRYPAVATLEVFHVAVVE